MTTRQKILIGGLGALTPIVMNLLILDFEDILKEFDLPKFLGYLTRVVILFYLGGLVAFLHKDEKNPTKLFELGIFAPALITSFLNGIQVDVSRTGSATEQQNAGSVLFVLPAYAQTADGGEIKTFSPPETTFTEQFMRGLTGLRSQRRWFVIVGSHLKLEDANRQVQEIKTQWQDFNAEVYAPYGRNPYYAVVIGANLTYKKAQELRERAIAAGFPEDTYLWVIRE